MIEPSQDRLDYGAILASPEDGFELDFAVACTYSLDLSALMASLIPLGFGGDSLGDCRDNPVFMLHALKKLLPKLYVFCDASEIKYPDIKEHRLLNMLDRAVFPVNRKAAFHPKFWLLKYVKGRACRYRLVILSKNISFDRCWDVAMYFDGKMQDTPGNGAPLANMLDFLKKTQRGKDNQPTRLSALAKEIEFVSFGNEDIRPESFSLIPLGIDNKHDWPFWGKYDCMLVISPFLSEESIRCLFQKTQDRKMLFSRREALSAVSPDLLSGIECYCIRDEIFNGEQSEKLSQAVTHRQNQDIHAKIYLLQGSGVKQDMYIGSANLTSNGLGGRNVELLVGMKFRSYNIYETMCRDLLHEGKNDAVFVKYQPEAKTEKSDSEKSMDALRDAFKNLLLSVKFGAKLEEKEGQVFAVHVKTECARPVQCDLEIAPIGGGIPRSFKKGDNLPGEICFELPIEALSNFYSITMRLGEEKLKRILSIETLSKDCLKNRDEAVEKSCLKSSGQLMEYLSYMLADDAYSEAILRGSSAKRLSDIATNRTAMSGIYEQMLSCAAKAPSRLQKIKDVIGHSSIANADLDHLLRMCELFCKISGGAK